METKKHTESNVHSYTNATLDRSANIVTIPRHTLGNVRVDPGSKQKTARIFDMRVLRGNEHDQTNQCGDVEPDHEQAASLEFVCGKASGDTTKAGHDVRRHSHELGLFVGVTQSLDDGGQEERDRV